MSVFFYWYQVSLKRLRYKKNPLRTKKLPPQAHTQKPNAPNALLDIEFRDKNCDTQRSEEPRKRHAA